MNEAKEIRKTIPNPPRRQSARTYMFYGFTLGVIFMGALVEYEDVIKGAIRGFVQ